MGVGPGCTIALVEHTPHRLRYLLTASGTGAVTTLPNTGGVTPDLTTDCAPEASPLRDLVTTPIASQAEARRLLMGEQSVLTPNIAHVHRAHCYVTPRAPKASWAVDVDVSSGKVVVKIDPPSSAQATAYLDVYDAHTFTQ